MKKILLSALAAMIGVAGFADDYGFTMLTQGANTQMMWAIGISPDGHYVTCSHIASALCDTQTSAVYNVEDEGEFNAVTNSGLMLGWLTGAIYAYNPLDESATLTYGNGGSNYAIARGATADESIIVGDAIFNYFQEKAFYKKSDGELTLLPYPTEAEVGCAIQGTVALNVSDDGKYICGYAIDEEDHQGALLWVLNDDGEYELEVLCKGIFPKPYYFYTPTAMSHNGKYMAFTLQDNDGEYGGAEYVGLYDVENREMIATATLPSGGDCSSTRIANDGTILVHSGDLDSQARHALIWLPDTDGPQYMRDVYPEVEEFGIYDDDQDWNYPTDVTPDGRYICGMAFYYFEGEGEDYARRIGWVFDRQKYAEATADPTGIKEVSTEPDGNAGTEYYSIDGKKLSAPQKGLNILKTGSKVTKTIIK